MGWDVADCLRYAIQNASAAAGGGLLPGQAAVAAALAELEVGSFYGPIGFEAGGGRNVRKQMVVTQVRQGRRSPPPPPCRSPSCWRGQPVCVSLLLLPPLLLGLRCVKQTAISQVQPGGAVAAVYPAGLASATMVYPLHNSGSSGEDPG